MSNVTQFPGSSPAVKPTKPPTPPRHLKQHGRKLWAALLAEYKIDDAGSVQLLAQLCEQLDRLRSVQARLRKEGLTVKGKTGLRAHPLVRVEADLHRGMLATVRALKLDLVVE